jgi:hypothetical protein
MRAESSLRFLPLSDGKQPLFMWLTIPFFKFITDPLLAGRVISALSGIVTGAAIVMSSQVLFKNPRLSLTAGLVWAVLPFAVFFNRMALVDSLLTMFFILAFLFFVLAVVHVRLDAAMLAGFVIGFAWLTKSSAVFAIALLPVLFVFNPKKLFVSCLLFLAAFVIGFGMYNILRLGPEFHQIGLRNADYVHPLSEVLRHPLDPLKPHLGDTLGFYWYLLTPLGMIFALFGIVNTKRDHLRQRLVLALWVLVPVFTQSFMAKAYTARYILFTLPFVAILIAHGLEHFGQHSQKSFLKIASTGLLVIVCLGLDLLMIYRPQDLPLPRIERAGYLEEWTAGFGIREVSDQIKEFAKSGPVLVGSEGFFGTPFDGLQMYLNQVPNVRVIGVGVWIDSVHEKLKNALTDNQVFLVVNSTRFHHPDPEKIGLKLIASYPKALRPDNTREYLLFFRVEKK